MHFLEALGHGGVVLLVFVLAIIVGIEVRAGGLARGGRIDCLRLLEFEKGRLGALHLRLQRRLVHLTALSAFAVALAVALARGFAAAGRAIDESCRSLLAVGTRSVRLGEQLDHIVRQRLPVAPAYLPRCWWRVE